MSEQEENVELVREAMEAFQRGDMEQVLSSLDPEVEVFSTPDLANRVDTTGRDAWLQWVGDWLEPWEEFAIEAEKIEAVGERHVIVDMRQRATGKGSGVEVELLVYTMFEIRVGVATRYHLYSGREQALAAAREGESA